MKHRSARFAPFLDLGLADDEHVYRPTQTMKSATQPHHLRMSIGHMWLNHQKVQIAPGASVATRV